MTPAAARLSRTAQALLAAALFCVGVGVQAGERIRVSFVSPEGAGNPFWDALTGVMRAAAHDLDIELDVRSAGGGRYKTSEQALEAIHSNPKPDYLVFIAQASEVGTILAAAEAAQVRAFTVNTGVLQEDRVKVGVPREKYRLWIGHMSPDDVQAGFDLAQALMREARALDASKPLEILGISGGRDSAVSMERNVGLKDAISASGNAQLDQIVFASWDANEAAIRTTGLLKRYPQTLVLWSASDVMAIAAIGAARSLGRNPGTDLLVGGMDWSDEALAAIARGDMAVSMGGHFLEGAWTLVLLHDYHHGQDFAATSGASLRSQMHAIDRNNVAALSQILGSKNWDGVDFRQFSRVLNPALESYDFSFEAFRAAIDRTPSTPPSSP